LEELVEAVVYRISGWRSVVVVAMGRVGKGLFIEGDMTRDDDFAGL
jgi:hypothetical protein